jgi:penicillin-binding protein 1C
MFPFWQRWKTRIPRGSRVRRWAFLGTWAAVFFLLSLGAAYRVPLPHRLRSQPSRVLEFRDGSVAHVFLSEDERWRIGVNTEEVDPAYVRALLHLEDQRFYWHPGVDPLAVLRATYQNLTRRRRVSGASTLTLQLVRVLEPRPRTWWSKSIEALRALQFELRLSKQEVLAAYLQFTPYGRNIEGVAAASLAYFGHRPKHLSPAEIAVLLAVPQNPTRRYPSAQNLRRLAAARDEIASRLLSAGILKPAGADPAAVLAEVKASPPPSAMKAFPRHAPHVAHWLRNEKATAPALRLTLDSGLQAMVERLLQQARPEAVQRGIRDAAVVVVDHSSGEIRALVGNHDFWDGRPGAQIPAFAAPRSPGSALKPFLYALALDRAEATPEMLVEDTPTAYGSWSPKNFDGTFVGLVPFEDALARSLNLPFVALLRRVGIETFVGTLRQMGTRSLVEAPGHYGLSAAIGGLEMTPLELAAAYATLARNGEFVPVHWQPGPVPDSTRVFSRGAAYLTRRALLLRDRPDFPERRRMTGVAPGIHWKTGTSFGHRDAWAAGSNARHTAVIWTGNLDNTASVHLVGAEAAAPLLFDVLEAAALGREDPPPVPPSDLAPVEVCAYSGYLPTEACTDRKDVLLPRRSVVTARCPFHVRVDVDEESGLALSPSCRKGRQYSTRSYLTWPVTVKRWLAHEHRVLPEVPPLSPGCDAAGETKAPAIVSPAAGQVALLVPGVPLDQQEIPLEAEADGRTSRLTWFVNGQLLGTAAPGERVWWTPSPGSHEVFVTDGSGLTHARRFEVAWKRR